MTPATNNRLLAVGLITGSLVVAAASAFDHRSPEQARSSVSTTSAYPVAQVSEVLQIAAAPSAYTISAMRYRDPGPEPVTAAEIAKSLGDEAPHELKARANAALRTGRVIPAEATA